MKRFNKFLVAVLAVAFMFGLSGSTAVLAASPLTVDLGTAAPFAILAYTEITDAGGASLITGNVGLSPTTGASIGLLSSQVTGKIYSVDAAGPAGSENNPALLTLAKNDLTTAYTVAANRTPVTTVPSELGGTTKYAGIYDSSDTKFGITAGAGHLTLDGQGNSDAVFIFEGSFDATPALTVGPGSTVDLINGACASNVFWRVTAATINTTAVFKGNILASTSITVANGANIEGRLLAQTGNVTLDHNTVSVPTTCATSDTAAATAAAAAAKLPSTGIAPTHSNTPLNIAIVAGVFALSTLFIVIRRKKRAI